MSWYGLFKPHILERGAIYYEDGSVSEFDLTDTGIEAQVDGTHMYNVSIELTDGQVTDMSCDCPYAEDGGACKHMAAVLYQYEEVLEEEGLSLEDEEMDCLGDHPDAVSSYNPPASKTDDAAELVNRIPEEDLRKILAEFVRLNPPLYNRLQLQYTEKLSPMQKRALKEEIAEIVQNNSIGGFIDWRHASEFTLELITFLDDKIKLLIENKDLEFAFELINEVFYCIGTVDIDDSDGGISEVAHRCYDYWKQILELGDEQFKNTMRSWFRAHRHGYVPDVMEEYLEEFLACELCSEEFLGGKIEELDRLLERDPDTHKSPSWYSVYEGLENVVLLRITYMRKLGCTEKDVQEFLEKNRRFYIVRELEINEVLQSGDIEKAIQLLLESREMDAGYPEQLKKYSEQLADLYTRTGDMENYKKELLFLLCNFRQTNLTHFKALKKEITRKEEWNCLVDMILKADQNTYFDCMVLNEEERFEELLSQIKTAGDIHLLDQYEKVLGKRFPSDIVELYRNYVIKMAVTSSQRKDYRYVVNYLKKIKKYAGGERAANDLAEQWRSEYKRRRAMMDELTQAGF